ncbi:hypothetical protein E3O62_14025 [Cryobacterium sp. TMT2-15-1]|uniref:hypothetical protein n=1 Tax=Cryobacterium sp. TMT2-15-1 TaxID=1259246 RepID=UPI00106D749E|nr:hypothetical protein [Cryobacterium sp. TMT2-15-1]TFC55438.1 hypothetical protein E3O62_14025 [Cryobacterium sp. TMT2-15-1]
MDTSLHNLAQARARLLNEVIADLCSGTNGATFVSLPAAEPADGATHNGQSPLQHQFWARQLAPPLIALLATRPEPYLPRQGQAVYSAKAELARQKAVDQLEVTSAAADKRLMRIVELA